MPRRETLSNSFGRLQPVLFKYCLIWRSPFCTSLLGIYNVYFDCCEVSQSVFQLVSWVGLHKMLETWKVYLVPRFDSPNWDGVHESALQCLVGGRRPLTWQVSDPLFCQLLHSGHVLEQCLCWDSVGASISPTHTLLYSSYHGPSVHNLTEIFPSEQYIESSTSFCSKEFEVLGITCLGI